MVESSNNGIDDTKFCLIQAMFTSHEDLSEHVCEETHNETSTILTEIVEKQKRYWKPSVHPFYG